MQKWEYLCLKQELITEGSGFKQKYVFKLNYDIEGKTLQDKMNALGKEGWELVSIIEINHNHSGISDAGLQYYFKRPISN